MEKTTDQKQKNVEVAEKEAQIKVVDDEGYDIEQFLCRCSNKTSVLPF